MPGRLKKTNARLLRALAGWTFWAAVVCGAAEKPDFESIRPRIASTTDTVVLATVNGTTITNQVLRSWLDLAKPLRYQELSTEQVLGLPASDLADVISEMGFYVMARVEALKERDFATTGLPEVLDEQWQRALKERYFEKELLEKYPPMTEQEARKWYEDNISLYTEPFTFSVRVIFLSTYRPFIIRKSEIKGNVGTQIARDEIGDIRALNRILDPLTSTPIFTPPHPNAVADFFAWNPEDPLPQSLEMLRFLPPLPPVDGQRVYIPMKEAERKAVRARMEKIVEQLKAGADFTTLAKEHSDEPKDVRGLVIGPLPLPGRPLLESVLDAARKTPVGQMTPILETPHGFLVMEIVSKSDRTVRPFEDVSKQLIQEEAKARQEQAWEEHLRQLFKDPLLKVDRETLMKDGAPDSAVIARVGDFEYTWGDYRRETGRRYSAPPTYEGRLQLLENSAILRQRILLAKAVEMGLENDPRVKMRIAAADTIFRGRAYLEWYALKRIPISDEVLRKFYNDQKDRFREPARYTLRELVRKLEPDVLNDPKGVETLTNFLRNDIAKRIKSERTFAREAAANANWPVRERDRGAARDVAEDYRGPEFAKTLSTLETGRCLGPFQVGDEVFLLWISNRSSIRYRPFDQVRTEVENMYRREHFDQLMLAAEQEIRSRHKLDYMFTFAKKGSDNRGRQSELSSQTR